MLAYVVIANRRYTDLFEWGQRSVPLSLAAEIQHRLLPGAFTCEAGQFTLAGWLEPAGEIAGDTFDFSLERDTLHLSMTDAMGHTSMPPCSRPCSSARCATRAGVVSLAGRRELANDALPTTGGAIRYRPAREHRPRTGARRSSTPATRRRCGCARAPSRFRCSRPAVRTQHGRAYRVQALPLELGDRLFFVTDGMLERDAEVEHRHDPPRRHGHACSRGSATAHRGGVCSISGPAP